MLAQPQLASLPFLPLALGAGLGVGLGAAYPNAIWVSIAGASAGAALVLAWALRNWIGSAGWGVIAYILSGLAMAGVGAQAWQLQLPDSQPKQAIHLIKTGQGQLRGYVFRIESQQLGRKGITLKGEIMQLIHADGKAISTTGLARVWMPASATSFYYGDKLLVSGLPDTLQPGTAQIGMDFDTYFTNQGYHLTHFLKGANGIQFLKRLPPTHPMRLIERVRWSTEKQLLTYLNGGTEAAVGVALLLGLRHHVSEETNNAYAAAGTLHALAVSGMHVVFLFGAFWWLSQWLPLSWQGTGRVYRRGFILILIWVFVAITGFQASIVRAAVVFTLMHAGRMIYRQSGALNGLLAAFCLLLIYKPNYLFDIGFQLSFAAVGGILLFMPWLERFYIFKNRVSKFIWQGVCLTLAAQLGASLIALVHFHQFPTYFMVSNLPVGLLSALAMGALTATVVFGWVPVLGSFISHVTQGLIWLLNQTMVEVAKWPGALLQPIAFTWLEALLASVIGLVLFAYLTSRKVAVLQLLTVLVIGWGIWQTRLVWQTAQQHRLLVFANGAVVQQQGLRAAQWGNLQPEQQVALAGLSICRTYAKPIEPFAANQVLLAQNRHNLQVPLTFAAQQRRVALPASAYFLVRSDKQVSSPNTINLKRTRLLRIPLPPIDRK